VRGAPKPGTAERQALARLGRPVFLVPAWPLRPSRMTERFAACGSISDPPAFARVTIMRPENSRHFRSPPEACGARKAEMHSIAAAGAPGPYPLVQRPRLWRELISPHLSPAGGLVRPLAPNNGVCTAPNARDAENKVSVEHCCYQPAQDALLDLGRSCDRDPLLPSFAPKLVNTRGCRRARSGFCTRGGTRLDPARTRSNQSEAGRASRHD